MKRVHFREVVKKLNELKQSGNKQALEQFRNTKVSELHYLFKYKSLTQVYKSLIIATQTGNKA